MRCLRGVVSESAEDPPIRISWTRIRNHQECQRKGALVSAGMKSPVTDARNWFHGTVVDLVMRRWLEQDDPQPGWMAAHVDEILEKAETDCRETGDGVVRWRDPRDKDRVRAWCRRLVVKLEPILQERVLPHEYQPAWRFKTPLTVPGLDGRPRKVLLIGEMDLFTRNRATGVTSVLDLKGTEDTSYWRKVSAQLVFYEIAAKLLTGQWPEISRLIQPMCPEPVMSFTFTDDDRREMLGIICSVAADIWRGQLPPKADNAGCSWCPVKSACPKFAHSRGRVPAAG